MPNGKIQEECIERLHQMGEWMNKYGYAIYGTKQGFTPPQTWGVITNKGKTYYIHILEKTAPNITLNIPNIKSAKWINIDSELKWNRDKKTGDVIFLLDGNMDEIDSIIEVVVK